MSGRNQAMEIFTCILDDGPVSAERVANETGWNRHVVDVAISVLQQEGMIEQAGTSEWGDPLWRSTSSFGKRA